MPKLKYVHVVQCQPLRMGTAFPVDMLRYDRCTPLHEADSNNIAASLRQDDVQNVTVHVQQLTETNDPNVTYARWRSFGWVATVTDTRRMQD